MTFNPRALIHASMAALMALAERASPGHNTRERLPSQRSLLRGGIRRQYGGAKAHRAVFIAEGNMANNRNHASSQIQQTGGAL